MIGNHEESELELFRREVLNKDGVIEILQNNIKELQGQLQESYIRIKDLREELDHEKDKNDRSRGSTHTDYGTAG